MKNHLLRLLSQVDKNPLSPYYGCFDRNFWHYQMSSEFPGATYQMGVLPLTIAYIEKIDSEFYHNPEILKIIMAGINYWSSIQNKDGSFNEWYPNEHSIVATAFTAYGITESILRLPTIIQQTILEKHLKTFKKIGHFLNDNIDTIALNHTAGAITALYNIYLLTKDETYRAILEKNIATLLQHQSPEGWYKEYGEPDIGYLSLSIFFLAIYYKKSNDQKILESLTKAVRFLVICICPDGTAGGEIFSRNTKYLFRFGLYLLRDDINEAAQILTQTNNNLVNLSTVDDRYFTFFFLPDNILMYNKPIDFPVRPLLNKTIFFKHAQILIKETIHYKFIINFKKGGAFKLFDKKEKKEITSQLGYMYQNKKNICSSLGFNTKNYSVDDTLETLHIEAYFSNYSTFNPLAKLFIPFRLFNLTLEKFTFIHKLFDNYLKLKKIKEVTKASGILIRDISLSDTEVLFKDNFDQLKKTDLWQLHNLSFRFVPSSKYMINSEIRKQNFIKIDSSQVQIEEEFSW